MVTYSEPGDEDGQVLSKKHCYYGARGCITCKSNLAMTDSDWVCFIRNSTIVTAHHEFCPPPFQLPHYSER